MLGHPRFLKGLATFLEGQYGAWGSYLVAFKAFLRPCDPKTLMTTIGASMGTDLCFRSYAKAL